MLGFSFSEQEVITQKTIVPKKGGKCVLENDEIYSSFQLSFHISDKNNLPNHHGDMHTTFPLFSFHSEIEKHFPRIYLKTKRFSLLSRLKTSELFSLASVNLKRFKVFNTSPK